MNIAISFRSDTFLGLFLYNALFGLYCRYITTIQAVLSLYNDNTGCLYCRYIVVIDDFIQANIVVIQRQYRHPVLSLYNDYTVCIVVI